ncbi:MAG: FkbM family methyltransferase [Bacteroidia bacterium]|nr:FkbM family methyltransferase [Bacteroidia bacterium]MCZ2277069.1 FkbM family methyltransferase [Bacteroidia bacterium]
MLNKLFRQTLKPVKRVFHEPEYKEWLRLFDELRNWPAETEKQISISGHHFLISDAQAFLNMYENVFVNQCYQFKSSSSSPLIIDCGANIGVASIWFKRYFPHSHLLAFEPDIYLFKLLALNLNNCKTGKTELINQAVWNADSTLTFETSRKQDGKLSPKGSLVVKTVRLKTVLERFDSIDILKLDVEGAEFEILSDCSSLISRIKNIFVECHFKDRLTPQLTKVVEILESSGLKCIIQAPAIVSPLKDIIPLPPLEIFASRI